MRRCWESGVAGSRRSLRPCGFPLGSAPTPSHGASSSLSLCLAGGGCLLSPPAWKPRTPEAPEWPVWTQEAGLRAVLAAGDGGARGGPSRDTPAPTAKCRPQAEVRGSEAVPSACWLKAGPWQRRPRLLAPPARPASGFWALNRMLGQSLEGQGWQAPACALHSAPTLTAAWGIPSAQRQPVLPPPSPISCPQAAPWQGDHNCS